MTDRRAFLSSSLALSLLPAVAQCRARAKPIVIVGAGIAGLGAAVALRAAGAQVIVVEARNRIGGRTHTSTQWPDLPMDMGASWIHGIKGNPVTTLAREAGAQMVGTSYGATKLHIDPALAALGVRGRASDEVEALFKKAIQWAERQENDVSLQTALNAVAPPQSLSPALQAQLNLYVAGTYEQEYAGRADNMSAWTIDDNEALPGGDVLFPHGYGQIVAHLARGLDIRLNHKVTRIAMKSDGAEVQFADATMMEADQVLVTVPLGVLKARVIQFDPPLSAQKQAAVERLGMGLLNKHWLRFDRVFWPKEFDWHEYLGARKGEWAEWVSLAKITDTPVLLVFSAAEHGEAIERLPDRDITAQAMVAARQMFGSSIPDPIAVQHTRWRSDPFALGSYSFNAVGSNNQHRAVLAESVGRLHFAGEATNARYVATVHGALISGRDAAQRVMAVLQ